MVTVQYWQYLAHSELLAPWSQLQHDIHMGHKCQAAMPNDLHAPKLEQLLLSVAGIRSFNIHAICPSLV